VATGSVAFFRFESAVPSGSLSCTVEPATNAVITYAGEMVVVDLPQLNPGLTLLTRITLKDASGSEMATAYLASYRQVEQLLPQVTVSEGRDRVSPAGSEGMAGPSTQPLADGARFLAGPGGVVVNLHVPLDVTEQALRAGLAVEPAGSASLTFTPNWSDGNILQVRWPGVNVEGERLPDPLEVAGTAAAPAGFVLEMSVTIDAAKVPAFAGLAGSDGLYRVDIERKTAPDFVARSLDNPAIALPYPGQRTIYHLPPGSHRFRLEFTTPMDRASVERRSAGRVASAGSQVKWALQWQDDCTLDVTLTPPAELPASVFIYPSEATDQQGLPLWFVEGLTVAWQTPYLLVRVPASDPASQGEVVVAAPPGVKPRAIPAGATYLLGYEPFNPDPMTGEGSDLYHPWLYEASSGRWADWAAGTFPWRRALWLDDNRIFVDRVTGWEVYDASTGEKSLSVGWDTSVDRVVGLTPDRDGERVAVLTSAPDRAWGSLGLVDLTVRGLDGNQTVGAAGQPGQPLTAVTRVGDDDFYLDRIPAAWIGEQALVLVDRPESGPMRLVRVDLASGQVTVLPGTEEASRWEADLFTVFGDDPVYCTFMTRDGQGTPETFVVYDLDAGKAAFRFNQADFNLGDSPQTCKPSPDGRYLALSGRGKAFVCDLVAQAKVGPGSRAPVTPMGKSIEGTVVGWSADGQWLYVSRPQ